MESEEGRSEGGLPTLLAQKDYNLGCASSPPPPHCKPTLPIDPQT